MRRRTVWDQASRTVLLLVAFSLVLLAAVFVYGAYASRSGGSIGRLADLAGIYVLVLTAVPIAVALVRTALWGLGAPTRPVPSASEMDRAVAAVRQTSLVLRQGEAEGHGLLPDPIRVIWSRADHPAGPRPMDNPNYGPTGKRASVRTSGDFSGIVSAYRRLPNGRLVILGEPGAGKSSLAVQLALGLLDDTGDDGKPVPVLLSLSSWQPGDEGEHLNAWMARRLAEDYPFLKNSEAYGDDAATALVAAGRVIPVLDGLDELPQGIRPTALAGIDAATARRPVVLTCRTGDYRDAVKVGGRALADTEEIELHDVEPTDAAHFLTQGSPQAADRWSAVLARLAENSDAPLALAFHSPLMVALARGIYADPATSPAELIDPYRFPDQTAIERHLLNKFIPTIYRNPSQPPSLSPAAAPLAEYNPERAGRWLTFIAELLTANHTADLAWWHLIEAVPRIARIILSAMAFTAFYVPTSAIVIGIAASISHGITKGLTVGLVAGACGGLPAGLGYGLAGEFVGTPGPSLSRVRLRPRSPNSVALAAGIFGFGITGAAIGGWVTAVLLGVTGALIVITWDIMESPADAGQFVDASSAFGEDIRVVRTRGIVFCLGLGIAGLFLSNVKTAIIGSIGFGLAGGIINGMGTKAWGRFTVARAWLVFTRRLPFKTREFLEDARMRGALRHAGALYQFRHEKLRSYLSPDTLRISAQRQPRGTRRNQRLMRRQ